MRKTVQLHGEVGLADALIALEGLDSQAEQAARAWLPGLLGIDLPIRADAETAIEPSDQSVDAAPPDRTGAALGALATRRRHDLPPEPDPDRPPTDRDHAPTIPSTLTWNDQPAGTTGDWYMEAAPLPPAQDLRFESLPPLRPLFDPRRNRSVLSGALSTRQLDGDLDLDTLIDHATNLRPILEFPRLPAATMRLGLQLLLDRGRGLLPYHRDQDLLIRDIEDIAGRDRLEIRRFEDHPFRKTGNGPKSEWTPSYRPPAPGVPVVLLTDLGLARTRQFHTGASVDEWLRFAHHVRAAGCPILAIVPALPDRIPADLRAHFRVLPWSRTTTIATVRSLLGQGLQVS